MTRYMLGAIAILTGSVALAQQPNNVVVGDTPPERDARGIPVISAPAEAPPGANQMITVPPGAPVVAAPNQQAVFASRMSTENYPACTAEITDNCVQAYVGRRAKSRR